MRASALVALVAVLCCGCDLSRSTAPEPQKTIARPGAALATGEPSPFSLRGHYDADGLVIEVDAKLDSSRFCGAGCSEDNTSPPRWGVSLWVDTNMSGVINPNTDVEFWMGSIDESGRFEVFHQWGRHPGEHEVSGHGQLRFRWTPAGFDMRIPYEALLEDQDGAILTLFVCNVFDNPCISREAIVIPLDGRRALARATPE